MTLVEQVVPVKPGAQVHANDEGPVFEQAPPLPQGLELHGNVTLAEQVVPVNP